MPERKRVTRKPRGVAGSYKVTFDPATEATVEFEPVEFGESKEDIERRIAEGFLSVMRKHERWKDIQLEQNPQDDFDFQLVASDGRNRHLELMEVAPLGAGGYTALSHSYKPYDLAAWTHKHLMEKSAKYTGSTGNGLLLLLYVTDDNLFPSETMVNILRALTGRDSHSFSEIHLVKPTALEPIHWEIYPAQELIPPNFDINRVQDNMVTNLGPIQVVQPSGNHDEETRILAELLGRPASEKLVNLYVEVLELRPDSYVAFQINKDITSGTAEHEYTDPRGRSTIRLPANPDELLVAHGLLHSAYLRRGNPIVLRKPGAAGDWPVLQTYLEDALRHPRLWQELRARGFDDSAYWASFASGVQAWNGGLSSLAENAQPIVLAFKLAELLTCTEQRLTAAVSHVEVKYPAVFNLAEQLAKYMTATLHDGRNQAVRLAGVRMLKLLAGEVYLQGGGHDMLDNLGVSFVFRPGQLNKAAMNYLAIQQSDHQISLIRTKSDGIIGHFFGEDIEPPSTISLGEYLMKYGLYYSSG